jgi:hypothetical protein
MAKRAYALLLLGLTGCYSPPVPSPTSWSQAGTYTGISVGLGITQVATDDHQYKKYYAKSDCATVLLGAPSWGTQVTFLLVDGQPTDQAGFPYWYFCYCGTFVPPGHHRFVVKMVRGLRTAYSMVDMDVTVHRVYRLALTKQDKEDVLQVWDETEGAMKRTLQNEVRNPPADGGFLPAMRAFKVNPDSAIVIGDSPKRFNGADKEYVLFRSIDGARVDGWNYPSEMFQTRFVPAGVHRMEIDVQGAGLLPGFDFRTLPGIEAEFVAQHVYRITSTRTQKQDLVQFWEETPGTAQRMLVKEYRLVRASHDPGH